MPLPFFFIHDVAPAGVVLQLPEETSRHIIQVLRMKTSELLQLTDGKGNLATVEITESHKTKCMVSVLESKHYDRNGKRKTIAISLLKNANRFEWFLEKSTEIGITAIIPLICERTEKANFRVDRMKNILISAMLQSQQTWLPDLNDSRKLREVIHSCTDKQRFIAHCAERKKVMLVDSLDKTAESQIILIGPEGDFTNDEIEYSLQHHFIPVSLGETRLRTETAGIAAAILLASC